MTRRPVLREAQDTLVAGHSLDNLITDGVLSLRMVN